MNTPAILANIENTERCTKKMRRLAEDEGDVESQLVDLSVHIENLLNEIKLEVEND